MTEIEFVGYSAVHPSDFIYDVPNGFTGYLLLLFDSPSELLIDGRLTVSYTHLTLPTT